MFWNIMLAVAMWAVGVLLFSTGMLQILIILFCAIPATKRFSAGRWVDTGTIYRRCLFTALFWLVISTVVIGAVLYFGNAYAKVGFLAGLGITALLSIGKWGMNPANLQDYFAAYGRCYAEKDLRELFGIGETDDAQRNKRDEPLMGDMVAVEREEAYQLVSRYAQKNEMSLVAYCLFCLKTELAQSGIQESEAEQRAQEQVAGKEAHQLVYEIVRNYADKNQMTVMEYINYCIAQETSLDSKISDAEIEKGEQADYSRPFGKSGNRQPEKEESK